MFGCASHNYRELFAPIIILCLFFEGINSNDKNFI